MQTLVRSVAIGWLVVACQPTAFKGSVGGSGKEKTSVTKVQSADSKRPKDEGEGVPGYLVDPSLLSIDRSPNEATIRCAPGAIRADSANENEVAIRIYRTSSDTSFDPSNWHLLDLVNRTFARADGSCEVTAPGGVDPILVKIGSGTPKVQTTNRYDFLVNRSYDSGSFSPVTEELAETIEAERTQGVKFAITSGDFDAIVDSQNSPFFGKSLRGTWDACLLTGISTPPTDAGGCWVEQATSGNNASWELGMQGPIDQACSSICLTNDPLISPDAVVSASASYAPADGQTTANLGTDWDACFIQEFSFDSNTPDFSSLCQIKDGQLTLKDDFGSQPRSHCKAQCMNFVCANKSRPTLVSEEFEQIDIGVKPLGADWDFCALTTIDFDNTPNSASNCSLFKDLNGSWNLGGGELSICKARCIRIDRCGA